MSHAHMFLSAFRVTNFRSVHDSGWIDAGDVTALIGTNESGKTNLLLPLWKLNPAKEGDIKLISDAPRKDYNAYRQMQGKKPVFITARFSLSDTLATKIAGLTGVTADKVKRVEVSRNFDGEYKITFPDATPTQQMPKADISKLLFAARGEIDTLQSVDAADEAIKVNILQTLDKVTTDLNNQPDTIGSNIVSGINKLLTDVSLKDAASTSLVVPRFKQILKPIQDHVQRLGKPGPNDNKDACDLVQKHLPVFVYYSTYGNLDSEIYLPHVIENLKRTDLSTRDEARARTLRVLFDFVHLKPEEIQELGKDHNEQTSGKATPAQIEAYSEKKKERSVLLQSASTDLTAKFRDWWKQGEYRFRFEADGNHFRIWVSDDKRTEEIELEGRSTGLQWFLSFYLIFLVESTAAHNGAILLLDEPGHTLHPVAQRDLALFFENLAKSNQLLYTTHSPFLIDADHLDRIRAVFVDNAGHTNVSTDLRAGQKTAKSKSIYPVHAALGLSVRNMEYQGCRTIIVEGPSDQLYLSAIKTALMNEGKISPSHELLFVPSSGTRAIKAVASIISGKEDDLPVVLCDGDTAGQELAKNLRAEMYAAAQKRVGLVTDFIKTPDAEIEDLFPTAFMSQIIDRYLNGPSDSPFVAVETTAIIPQVKAYAKEYAITLSDGWKVEVARLVKARIATHTDFDGSDWKNVKGVWQRLFQWIADDAAGQSKPAKVAASV